MYSTLPGRCTYHLLCTSAHIWRSLVTFAGVAIVIYNYSRLYMYRRPCTGTVILQHTTRNVLPQHDCPVYMYSTDDSICTCKAHKYKYKCLGSLYDIYAHASLQSSLHNKKKRNKRKKQKKQKNTGIKYICTVHTQVL